SLLTSFLVVESEQPKRRLRRSTGSEPCSEISRSASRSLLLKSSGWSVLPLARRSDRLARGLVGMDRARHALRAKLRESCAPRNGRGKPEASGLAREAAVFT